MVERWRQIVLVVSIGWISWLTMMLVHESGHVLGALCTGGTVRRVVWQPAIISRTDVLPNPHPLVEVWAGPLFGSLFPLAVAAIAFAARLPVSYLFWIVAGFCLIANGAYIGIGVIQPVGDANEMLEHGMASWPMAVFGLITLIVGLWIWHRVSPRLGFGAKPAPIAASHAYVTLIIAVLFTALGFAFGNRGN
jgi:hypothetical protein